MQIKSVRYHRHFNIGDYNNEQIELMANVEEGEKPEVVMALLQKKVWDMHRFMNAMRYVSEEISRKISERDHYEHNRCSNQMRMEALKVDLNEIDKILKDPSRSLEKTQKLRHACNIENYEKLQMDIARDKQNMERVNKEINIWKEVQMKLEIQWPNGDFQISHIEELKNKPIDISSRRY